MVQGFAFGTGSSIAREAVGSVMGGRGEQAPAPEQQPAPQQQQFGASQSAGVCAIDNEQLMSCLRANSSNAGACDFYFTALQQCQAREGS